MKDKIIICSKYNEALYALIPFEVEDVIKIFSTYWLLIKKILVLSLSKIKILSCIFLILKNFWWSLYKIWRKSLFGR